MKTIHVILAKMGSLGILIDFEYRLEFEYLNIILYNIYIIYIHTLVRIFKYLIIECFEKYSSATCKL